MNKHTMIYYQPPTTEKEPKQKTEVMGLAETMGDADKFKAAKIKENPELRKGSWFYGGVRI